MKFNFYIVIVVVPLFFSCKEIEKSSVNRDLAEVKIQAMDIKHKLYYYFLENKTFPENLGRVGVTNRLDLKSGINASWTYTVLDNKTKCQLITSNQIEGYFVFINQNGNVSASQSLPKKSDISWTVPYRSVWKSSCFSETPDAD